MLADNRMRRDVLSLAPPPAPLPNIEDRLIDLETRAAHYERMVDDLSDVIARQADAMAMLSAQVKRLAKRMGDIEGGWGPSPQDSKPPPHY
jgi:SlyX protein